MRELVIFGRHGIAVRGDRHVASAGTQEEIDEANALQ